MSAEMKMRCEDVAPYLSAFADGELAEPLRSEVAEHIATCDACTATLARYAEIDALFAALPRSAPPSEALDQILAAVAIEDEQAERRHALRTSWGASAFKRRLTELDMPEIGVPPRVRVRSSQRAQWVSVAIPAIAALLLISVTLVTFHWLPGKAQIFPVTTQPTATPAPGNITLAQTRIAVEAIQPQLSFKPVLPTYLPDGATLADVVIGPRDSDISDHTLDITWNVTGAVHTIHLHEASAKVGLSGYSDLSPSPQLSWQIGNAPWRPAQVDTSPQNMAVRQQRAGVAIALDAPVQVNSSQGAAGQTMLRLISLSMDSPYTVMPIAPGENAARILPAQLQDMLAHYTAVALNGDGSIEWREETYVAPCASTAQPCQVRTSYSWGANGGVLYTDIASGQRLLHLDQGQKTYSWLPLLPTGQDVSLNNTGLPRLFTLANTYLNTGILWYMGETNYQGQRVYDLLWTSAPTRTHVYVSVTTHTVVAMAVAAHTNILKGGPIAGTGSLSCLRYTMIEYVAPDTTTDALFAQTIPADFTQSQETPLPLTC